MSSAAAYFCIAAVITAIFATVIPAQAADPRGRASTEIAERMKTSREGYERLLAAYEEQLKIQIAEYARRKKLYQDGELAEVYVRMAVRDVVRTRTNITEIQRWILEDDLALTEAVARTAPPLGKGGYEDSALLVRYNGQTAWSVSDAGKIESFFLARFGRALPVSARGQTAAHDRMGFDHHNAMDVALYPDSEEGRAVMQYLKQSGIPFIAFRGKIAGSATGAHIHIGKPSLRLASPR